ncbi:MAG: alanine--tRNA ligase [Caldimicrobium sp.]|nr:alanine--tRNA ligase [Caldimicrobium sp.]MCX7613407.1 alanine--tRNA ligase [Caldimicrobium sp.]MDW8182387.1 alanine--tRNA ligase [Caldimicrobium sp.]
MKGRDIRSKFIEFFAQRDHTVVSSSSLIPANDPTLLFTNSGMVQFKRVFLGEETRPYKRAVTCQKCIRAGGKHNDLENVGYTARHHTFFEMLGNFSFGDYFKAEAIAFAWELITKDFSLPKNRLWVTVFREDEEAIDLWKKIAGFTEDRIVRLGEKDNFWTMGETGPCGPCSEIIYDQGEQFSCKRPDCAPGCDCDRYLEIWNLVFMQYERDENGNLKPLPKPSIDTGMGLERITSVLQGVPSNYDTDLFAGIINLLAELSGRSFKENHDTEIAFRVIADHLRASAFLIAEGVMPSNEGRGYVLRRIIRRAERFGKQIGLKDPFLYKLLPPLIDEYGSIYPEVSNNQDTISRVLKIEEERFLETLNFGTEVLEKEVAKLQSEGKKVVPGELIFKLYDTYGFPYDLVRDYVLPLGFELDISSFETLREKARSESRKSWKGVLDKVPEGIKSLVQEGVQTLFVGYEELVSKGKILYLSEDYLVTDITPFYAEGGGQVSDIGFVHGKSGKAEVIDVQRVGDLIYHRIRLLEGKLSPGEEVTLEVNKERRLHIARHHSGTHLLHAALRKVLGTHVRQAGSLVEENRLRFDFTHFQALSFEELQKIERLVNLWVLANYPLEIKWLKKEEAEELGALAFFEEKYGDIVRVIKIDKISMELCGGTHVKATGEIGLFKIISESSVASGVRRIEALCGEKSYQYLLNTENLIQEISLTLKTNPKEVLRKIKELTEELNRLKTEIKALKSRDIKAELESRLTDIKDVDGVKLLVTSFQTDKMEDLREWGDYYKNKIKSGVLFLIGERERDSLAVCMVTKDLAKRISASEIFKKLSQELELKGGGKAELAQGSFTKTTSIDLIKKKLEEVLSKYE